MRAWRDPSISEIIGAGAGAAVVISAVALLALITYLGKWRYLWTEWLTSLDHKKIGIMYNILAGVMLSRALVEAVLIRAQQALAINAAGIVEPNHFAQLFSTHGSIMIFFMAMPFLTGLINYVVPLQIGARDIAFPYLNSIGFWLTAGGAGLAQPVLALPRYRLDRDLFGRLPAGSDPMTSPRLERRETMTYVVGYGLALLLIGAAFGLVYLDLLAGRPAFYAVLGLGAVQMVVQFRTFLHIDLRRSARSDLQLILFSTLIMALMVGGTLVVLLNLRTRMM